MVRRIKKPGISDCYCQRVTKGKRKSASGFKCTCYIKGKPIWLGRVDLYER